MADDPFSFATIQQRAKSCAERHGVELPAWSPTDSPSMYAGRCANLFREFAADPQLRKLDMTRVGDVAATMALASRVFDAAETARPHGTPDGGVRYVSDRSTGREIIRAYADSDDAVWRQFTNESFMVGKFRKPESQRISQPDFAPRAPK